MTLGHFSDNTPTKLEYIAKLLLVEWESQCEPIVSTTAIYAFSALARLGCGRTFPLRASGARRVYLELKTCSALGIRRLYAAGPAFKISIVASPEPTIA